MTDVFPDPKTPFGKRVRRRLADEQVIWLTTVGEDGTPQPNPVWFIDEGDTILIYNQVGARRIDHIRSDPKVALHFDGDGQGGDVVVITGRAEILTGHPSANEFPPYANKYQAAAAGVSGSMEAFANAYPTPVRISIDRVRGA